MADLKGMETGGYPAFFGTYAPKGDCAAKPRIVADQSGLTILYKDRKVHPKEFYFMYDAWGQQYQGPMMSFEPFATSPTDLGPLDFTFNADEKQGVLSVTSNDGVPGHDSALARELTGPSPYLRCGGPVEKVSPPPPPPPVKALEWSDLNRAVGKYPNAYSPFATGDIAGQLKQLMGPKFEVLQKNIDVSGPWRKSGDLYYDSGNRRHDGGYNQAYIVFDKATRAIEVGLWEDGKLTIYSTGRSISPLPPDIIDLREHSPKQDAVPPDTPWELRPVPGGAAVATRGTSGSPDIKSVSFLCSDHHPTFAAVLYKPFDGDRFTFAWNFKGWLVNVSMTPGNQNKTLWLAGLDKSYLPRKVAQADGVIYLRINGMLEGQVSANGAAAAVKTALQSCYRF